MKQRQRRVFLLAMVALLYAAVAQATDWWAYEAVSWDRLGNSPYDDPLAILGKPTVWINNSGAPGDPDPCAVSMVIPAWNVGWPGGEKLVTTILAETPTLPSGHITAKFATPIYDDPENWYGKDFIVFGNGFFSVGGSPIYSDSNMEEVVISPFGEDIGFWEPMLVSVSQDGLTWYSYTNGPYADDYAPTQALAWDWIENRWLKNSAGIEVELDFTRPLYTPFGKNDFAYKTVAAGIDMYRGSGGGTAFDLAELPLPVEPGTGRKWIQYVKVDGAMGEVDAISRVSHQIAQISIGSAKQLADGARVVLKESVVSAATYEVGRCCYVQHPDRSGGIKVMGRVLDRDKRYILYGDMDTVGDERVILATAATLVEGDNAPAAPLCVTNRNVAGSGLSTTGLLVKIWGKVVSVDQSDLSCVIDDGSGKPIKCIAPRDTGAAEPNKGVVVHPDYTPPAQNSFIQVTGISSLERNAQNQVVPVIRIRDISSVDE